MSRYICSIFLALLATSVTASAQTIYIDAADEAGQALILGAKTHTKNLDCDILILTIAPNFSLGMSLDEMVAEIDNSTVLKVVRKPLCDSEKGIARNNSAILKSIPSDPVSYFANVDDPPTPPEQPPGTPWVYMGKSEASFVNQTTCVQIDTTTFYYRSTDTNGVIHFTTVSKHYVSPAPGCDSVGIGGE